MSAQSLSVVVCFLRAVFRTARFRPASDKGLTRGR